jgi:ATP-dependent DNA helicase RecG
LREALLNALAHKDYGSGIPIQVSVYDHQIVIWSPGRLPEDWTLEKLLGKHPSIPFNPLVANAFFRAGYIESWGRGIEKIQRECREYDIPAPDFDHGMSGLMLTFHANPRRLKEVLGEGARSDERLGERLGEKLGEKLGETRAAIVRAMLANPKVTTTQLAQTLNISATAVEKNLKLLKDQGQIKRVGPAKGGHWEVLK